MAEDDIYGSKAKYENFVSKIDDLVKKPKKENHKKLYYCKRDYW